MLSKQALVPEARRYPEPACFGQAAAKPRVRAITCCSRRASPAASPATAQPSSLAVLHHVTDASDVGGDNRPPGGEGFDQGYGCPLVAAGKHHDVEVGKGRRDIGPPTREMRTVRYAELVQPALRALARSSPSPSTARCRPGTLATAENSVAWSFTGTSLPTMPASGTFSARPSAARSRPTGPPGVPTARRGARSKPRGTTLYCAGLPIPRSSSSSRTSGLTAMRTSVCLARTRSNWTKARC